ncbi:MAG TPA: OmpA family protein [Gemmatimonadales bacterium]|jgi:outer membrane protein OmpA-like peptidoglycan-associated protein
MKSLVSLLAVVAVAAIATPAPVTAQIGGMIRGAVSNKVNSKVQQQVDKAVDCAFGDQTCIDKAKADGKPVVVTDKNGKPLKDQSSAQSTSEKTAAATGDAVADGDPPGKGAWLNYDFIPGDRILFSDDFANDNVGDLPTHEDVTNGNVTIVDVKGTKYLRTETGGAMTITLPEVLPQRFTIEFIFHRKGGNGSGTYFHLGDDKQLNFRCDQGDGKIDGVGVNGPKESGQDVAGIGEGDFETCRLMVDGGYAKAYVNAVRVGQLNGLVFDHTNTIHVDVANGDENGSLMTGIRIAAGGKKLYDGLAATGRVATQGIYFDVSSARIRGESTPTLKEIGDMLTAHPELHLTIEGHTDNTGSATGNQTLSEQRAASVRQFLIDTYKIDAARLKSAGFGASKPAASNDTPEGRQTNRRVELVKN